MIEMFYCKCFDCFEGVLRNMDNRTTVIKMMMIKDTKLC